MKAAQDIIIAPVITEKSMSGIADKKYTFKVAKDANKIEIADAVEKLFKVNVAKVNTVSVRGKERRMGRYSGTPVAAMANSVDAAVLDPNSAFNDMRDPMVSLLPGHTMHVQQAVP